MSPPVKATYQIEVGAHGITCEPSHGNGRFHERTVLAWGTNTACTLRFFTYDSNKTKPAWPFVLPDPPPPEDSATVQPGSPFEGTLKPVPYGEEAPSYAYSIQSGDQTLDPIIIVDK